MATVTVHEAKTQLSKLIVRALAGEEIVIARGKEPVVRLVPFPQTPRRRVPGSMAGRIVESPGVWDPLTDVELAEMGL